MGLSSALEIGRNHGVHRTPWVIAASAAWFLSACAHRAPPPTETAMPWTLLTVADGAANLYRFTRAADGGVAFDYVPVTPEQSSSGTYSGGPPRSEQLAGDDPRLVELWAVVQKLEADEARHVPDRAMGTGAIGWQGALGAHDFILPMGAELNRLLALLARFGTPPP